MRIIGIDPGAQGGMVCIRNNSKGVFYKALGKLTEIDIHEILETWSEGGAVVYLEKVGGFIQGRGAQNGSAMFNFGAGYGFLRGVVTALKIRLEDVHTNTWQKVFALQRKSKSESDTSKKNRHKQQAQHLFPQIKVTHAIADALLIAEYGRRQWK